MAAVTQPAQIEERRTALLRAVAALVPQMQARATALDRDGAFPDAEIAALADAGLLLAPLPQPLGGLGAGTEPGGVDLLRRLLVLCGTGNPAVARLFEAHVNALRIVTRYGTPEQAAASAADALAGYLLGLWVTDPPGSALRVENGRFRGSKGPCSGAGHIARAVVTAEHAGGTHLFMVALAGSEPVLGITGLQGMRAAANGIVGLDGVAAGPPIGAPGDYLREPDFSCGAWRSSAAALGALEALVDSARTQLVARGQQDAPLQQARFGEILIARETARLWVTRACAVAEAPGDPAAQVASVNLARIAVEHACLDAIRHVQRGLGLAAFVAPHPAERLMRDLATYLRQPAADAVLTEAAAYFLNNPC